MLTTTKNRRRKAAPVVARRKPIRNSTVTFSVSCTQADLDMIARRLDSLVVLDRSAYLIALVRQDCVRPRAFTIVPHDQPVAKAARGSTITFSVSCTSDDLAMITTRVASLAVLDRSPYLIALVRQDCQQPREFTIIPRDQVVSNQENNHKESHKPQG
jgi:hypothetical protein